MPNYEMARDGAWGLQQLMPPDAAAGRFTEHWQSTMFGMGFVRRDDAQAEVDRLNEIQPGRWRVHDRQAAWNPA